MGLNALFASPSVLLDYYAPGSAGAPQLPSAAPGNASVTLHWRIPLTSGTSTIVGYVVTPFNGIIPLPPQSFPATPTTRTITGLRNGTSYIFKVAAINSSGLGPQSAASNAVRVGAPATPVSLKAIPGKNQATLKWFAPSTANGKSITGYVVTPYLTGVPQAVHVLNSQSTVGVVKGLLNGRSYTFRIAAKNANGTGLPSALSTAVLVAGAPAAPTGVSVIRVAPGQLRLTFVPGATNGLTIASFTATCTSGKGGGITRARTSTRSPITVTNLTINRPYTCNVAATNARGTGPASPKTRTITP